MRLITLKMLRRFEAIHTQAKIALEDFAAKAKAANWKNIQQVRAVYPHADIARVASGNTVTIFNIGGNKFRVITAIHYNRQTMYVLAVLTHEQYDKGHWKEIL